MRAGVILVMTAGAALAFACRNADRTVAADPPKIELKATVAPFDSVTVYAPIDGRVTQITAAEGATVRAGDLLLTLTNPTVARDAVYARTAVIAAEQRMRGTPVRSQPRTSLPQSRVQSNAERERVAASLVKQKQQKLDRLRALLASGDVAKQDVEYAEAELAAAQRDLSAERERSEQERQVPGAVVQAGSSPAILQAELDRAHADHELAQHRQSLLTVKTPAGGTLAKLRVSQGSDVYPRDVVAEIVDATTARVQAPLAPELFRFVRVGMPVEVKLSTIPPRRFREPIAAIHPPGSEGGAAVIVNIPNPDRMLQPGTPAIITIP